MIAIPWRPPLAITHGDGPIRPNRVGTRRGQEAGAADCLFGAELGSSAGGDARAGLAAAWRFAVCWLIAGWLSGPSAVSASEAAAAARQVQPAAVEHRIIVELASGRRIDALFDPGSDERRLRLRIVRPGVAVRMALDWSAIRRIEMGDLQHSADAFRRQFVEQAGQPLHSDQLGSAAGPGDGRTAGQNRIVVAPRGGAPDGLSAAGRAGRPPTGSAPPQQNDAPLLARPRLAARVASLEIEAELANLDAGAAADGLRVFVRPLDADGELVAARGSVQFELWIGQGLETSRTGYLARIQRWSVTLDPKRFTWRGQRCELTFAGWNPERQRHLGDHARLTARLSVPGSGVVEADEPFVRIRRFDPLRDRELQHRRVFH